MRAFLALAQMCPGITWLGTENGVAPIWWLIIVFLIKTTTLNPHIYTYIHYITLRYVTLRYITLHTYIHYITLHYITYIHTYIHVLYIYIYIYTYIYNGYTTFSNTSLLKTNFCQPRVHSSSVLSMSLRKLGIQNLEALPSCLKFEPIWKKEKHEPTGTYLSKKLSRNPKRVLYTVGYLITCSQALTETYLTHSISWSPFFLFELP